MINFKENQINRNLGRKNFIVHNDEQKEQDSQINFNNTTLFQLFDNFYNSLNTNDFDVLDQTIKSIITLIDSSNPIISQKMKQYSQITKCNIIETSMNLLISPPNISQKSLYLDLIISMFSIQNTEITEYVITQNEYIQFFDTILFQANEDEFIIPIIKLISNISDHLTSLNIRFDKLFPSFSIERIDSLFQMTQEYPTVVQNLFQLINKICNNLTYGKFHYRLTEFLMDHYQLNYDPSFIFDVLIQYIKKYPLIAFNLISEKNFLFGKEGQLSVFDFLCHETFQEKNDLFYSYCFYTLKFLNACVKKLNDDVKDEIFRSLPVSEICSLIFDENSSQNLCCVALKILIADYQSVKNENQEEEIQQNNENQEEEETQKNESFFDGPKIQNFSNSHQKSYFDGPVKNHLFEEEEEEFIESKPRLKHDKSYILYIFYDHLEKSKKIIQMFIDGNFKLKYHLLNMVKITVKELLHTGSPLDSKSEKNDMTFTFLNPYLIQVIAEMLLTSEEKLSALVVEFLDILITKALTIKADYLVKLISNEPVVDSLNEFIDQNEEIGSEVVQIAKYILSVIQKSELEK